jgi:hypothetical protein
MLIVTKRLSHQEALPDMGIISASRLKTHSKKKTEDWGVDLPNLCTNIFHTSRWTFLSQGEDVQKSTKAPSKSKILLARAIKFTVCMVFHPVSPLNNINIIALLTPPPRPHLLLFFAILPLFSTNVTCSQPSAAWGGVPEPPTINKRGQTKPHTQTNIHIYIY